MDIPRSNITSRDATIEITTVIKLCENLTNTTASIVSYILRLIFFYNV